MPELTLYSTAHCSLCDALFDILLTAPEAAGFMLSVVDIVEDEALFAQYAERVPVLVSATGEYSGEIELESVRQWLQTLDTGR